MYNTGSLDSCPPINYFEIYKIDNTLRQAIQPYRLLKLQ